jgi:hypothetical protein
MTGPFLVPCRCIYVLITKGTLVVPFYYRVILLVYSFTQVQAVLLFLGGQQDTPNTVPTSDFLVQEKCQDIWVYYLEVTLYLDIFQY